MQKSPAVSFLIAFKSRLRASARAMAVCSLVLVSSLIFAPQSVQAQLYWNTNGTAASWNAANWGTVPAGPFTTAWTNNTDAVFNANSSVSWVTNLQIGNITVANGVTVTLTPTGTLSTNGNIRTIDVGSGATLDFAGQGVSTTAGTGFIKNNSGTWIIGAQGNAYTGGFALNAGTIVISGNNAIGTGPVVFNGGTIQSSGTRTYAPSTFTIGGNIANSGTGNATWSTNLGLGSATRTITNSTTSGSRRYTGIISGSPGTGLTFDGTAGAQTYLGNTGNTFDGPISINSTNGAEVVFNDNGAFGGTTSITIDGGRLTMASMDSSGNTSALTTGTIAATRNIFVGPTSGTSISIQGATGVTTYNGVIADKPSTTGAWAKQGAGTLVLGGVSTYSGATAINNGMLQLASGNDRLPLSTTISLGQAASTNLGTLDLNGFNQQVAGLNSTSGTNAGVNTNSVKSTTVAVLRLSGSGTYIYSDGTAANSGVISGAISLVMSGSGKQTLGGADTYTGTTTVSGGTLLVNGTHIGGVAYTVLTGGTLGGKGTITANVNIQDGTLAPGASVNTLNVVGVLGLLPTSVLSYELDAVDHTVGTQINDLTEVTGDLTLDGALNVTPQNGSALSAGSYRLFDYTGALVNNVLNVGSVPVNPGFQASIDTSVPGQVNLNVTAVPEPSTLLLAAISSVGLAGYGLRRRNAGG